MLPGAAMKKAAFSAASSFRIDLPERQSHWLVSRDTRSEPLFPWLSVPPGHRDIPSGRRFT